MDTRLKEMLSRVDWKNPNSFEDLVRVQMLAFESALLQIQSFDPAVAGAYATTLTAGLPDHVRNVLFVAAQERQQEQWKAEAKVARQDWREEVERIRTKMVEILWAEWQQEVRREQMERGRILEQMAARWNRLTQQQTMTFALYMMDDPSVPLERKRSWEKAAMYDQITDRLYTNARARAKNPENLIIIDGLQQALSTDRLREAIQSDVKRSPEGAQTVAVADVEKRITEAVQRIDGLTPEQRSKVGDLVGQAVRNYASSRSLENGLPADAASLSQHVAGLRGEVSNALMNALMDEQLGLDPDVYDKLVEQVERRIDDITNNGPGHAAEFAKAHESIKEAMRDHGLDVSGMTVQDAAANIGCSALHDADRLIKNPSMATAEDLRIAIALSRVAEQSASHIASMEPPKPDLSRWQALLPLQQQGHAAQQTSEPEPADGYDPKPR